MPLKHNCVVDKQLYNVVYPFTQIMLNEKTVGKMITKIRLEHDYSKPETSKWRVEKIVLESVDGETKLEFPVNRWFAAEEENGETVREFPAKYPDEEEETPPGKK